MNDGWSWSLITAVASGTFVSEDGAAIFAGVLIADGKLTIVPALLAVFTGIWIGDIGLYLLGRFLRPLATRWTWAARKLDDPVVTRAEAWLNSRGWQAIAISRVLPASRLPTYLAAGLLHMNFWRFALWTAIAVAIWTPLIVLGSHQFIQPLWQPWQKAVGDPILAGALLLAGILLGIWLIKQIAIKNNRLRWQHRWRRRHHEWWPAWTLYLPLAPWFAWLGIKHRSYRAPFACNPGLLDSGMIGESKAALQTLAPNVPWLPWTLLPSQAVPQHKSQEEDSREKVSQRLSLLLVWMRQNHITFPVILKPDVGERGGDVKLARTVTDAARYLSRHKNSTLAQAFHPGPVEIGVFWSRNIKSPITGEILSVTDKKFPVITGNGHDTVAELIAKHPRFRLQYDLFAQRYQHRLDEVLAAGATLALTTAGNHCQGCCFTDGSELITPALNDTVNNWMRKQRHLTYGRFDIRASSYDDIRAGRNLAVIEMNGLSSEPTALYDPTWSYPRALRELARCWGRAFALGAQHRAPRVRNLFAVARATRNLVVIQNQSRDIAS